MVNRINLILQAKNITAKQFAEEIGVQPSGLSHILSGRNNPSLDFVMKVVRRYPEINITWLMFGTGEMYVDPLSVSQPSLSSVSAVQSAAPSGYLPDPPKSPKTLSSPGSQPSPFEPSPQSPIPPRSKYVKTDNMTLFDESEPTLPFENVSEQDLRLNRMVAPVVESVQQDDNVEKSTRIVRDIPLDVRREGDGGIINENLVNDSDKPPVSISAILGDSKKRVAKIVILYDDHTFSEYFPAE